jgi:hypothetical protein
MSMKPVINIILRNLLGLKYKFNYWDYRQILVLIERGLLEGRVATDEIRKAASQFMDGVSKPCPPGKKEDSSARIVPIKFCSILFPLAMREIIRSMSDAERDQIAALAPKNSFDPVHFDFLRVQVSQSFEVDVDKGYAFCKPLVALVDALAQYGYSHARIICSFIIGSTFESFKAAFFTFREHPRPAELMRDIVAEIEEQKRPIGFFGHFFFVLVEREMKGVFDESGCARVIVSDTYARASASLHKKAP